MSVEQKTEPFDGWLSQSKTAKILCVGDLMLDRFVYGTVDRVSPEAPIPILKRTHEKEMLGAAGNVARNVASLGAAARLIGFVGDDAEGGRLAELVGVETNLEGDLISVRGRRTTVKTRYVAGGQQLLRVDYEDTNDVADDLAADILSIAEQEIDGASVVLMSDYAKGALTQFIVDEIVALAKKYDVPVVVDPKGTDYERYGPVKLIKPNASELAAFVGRRCETDSEIEAALEAALDKTSCDSILVTRSSKGLSFLERGQAVQHLRGREQEVFDVSGAGDTSLAALGLALGQTADLMRSAQFALIASGIAVTKVGTAAVTAEEVQRQLLSGEYSRINDHFDLDTVIGDIERWRASGKRIGFTNGCFDILHPGHVSVLKFAKSRCDRLVVGLNSDASVKRLKGPDRPVNDQLSRAQVLLGLDSVDAVCIFDEDTPIDLITKIVPSVLVKGGDYTIDTVVGADVVSAAGGEVVIAPTIEGYSTTSIIERSKS